jgi:hypothetical protein
MSTVIPKIDELVSGIEDESYSRDMINNGLRREIEGIKTDVNSIVSVLVKYIQNSSGC